MLEFNTIKESDKKRIDESSYKELLKIWRFAGIGHPLLSKETGDYFKKVMVRKRDELSHYDKVRASKEVGWEV